MLLAALANRAIIATRAMSSYIPKERLAGKVAVVTASTDGYGNIQLFYILLFTIVY